MNRPAADHVEGAVARDASDPRAEVATAEKLRIAPNFQEHGLGHVFGGGNIAEIPQRQAIDETVVSIVEDFKRVRVTRPHSLHEPACVFHGAILRWARGFALPCVTCECGRQIPAARESGRK